MRQQIGRNRCGERGRRCSQDFIELPVAREDRLAKRRQGRAATVRAAKSRRHQRFAPASVHRVDHEPAAPVAKSKMPSRRRDRAGGRDRRKQVGLAWTEGELATTKELCLELQRRRR